MPITNVATKIVFVKVTVLRLMFLYVFSSTLDGCVKKIYVPRVEDKNSHMRMLNISSMDDLIPNSMDILEPAPVDQHGNAREDGKCDT